MVMFDPEDLADEAALTEDTDFWRGYPGYPENMADPHEAPCIHCGCLLWVMGDASEPVCPSCRRGYPEL